MWKWDNILRSLMQTDRQTDRHFNNIWVTRKVKTCFNIILMCQMQIGKQIFSTASQFLDIL